MFFERLHEDKERAGLVESLCHRGSEKACEELRALRAGGDERCLDQTLELVEKEDRVGVCET